MIDLHTHSTASDGTDSPADLVKKAYEAGIRTLALTDHDTLDGLEEAEETAHALGLSFVRGCEISTNTEYGSMHILGLWIPRHCDELKNFLIQARERRDRRNDRMLDKLHALGIRIELEELRELAKGSIGRPHVAQLLLEKGYVKSRGEAFSKYLGINGKAYVPKDSPRPEEAVQLMSNMGASVIIAHPLLRPVPLEWLEDTARALGKLGLAGLEAWHSSQDIEKTKVLSEIAQKEGLQISGGSDYHGLAKTGICLGHVEEGRAIPDFIYEQLLEYRHKMGLDNSQ